MRNLGALRIASALSEVLRCDKCGGKRSVPPAKGGRMPETVSTSKLGEFCECPARIVDGYVIPAGPAYVAPASPECARCSWAMQIVDRETNTWACVGDHCPDFCKPVMIARGAA